MKTTFFVFSYLVTNSIFAMTDKDLPHIDPHQAGQLYALMIKVDFILKEAEIPYWAGWGTLLGAIRHKGLIPWDDDLDIAILEDQVETLNKLSPLLNKNGLSLLEIKQEGNVDYYKIFPTNGKAYPEDYPWKYPFVDIFTMAPLEKDIRYASKRLREGFKDEYFLYEELEKLEEAKFGPLQIPIPRNAHNILERLYGDDWNEIAYAQYDHKEEKRLEKIKVPLIERAEVEYVLPE